MNKLIFFVVTISFLQLIQCVNDTLPVFVWTGKFKNGMSTFFTMLGYPDIYLQNFAQKMADNINSYDLTHIRSTFYNYQAIAYDARTLHIGISDITLRELLIFDLNTVLHTSFSNENYGIGIHSHFKNVTGLAFATNFNLLYWVDVEAQYIGVAEFLRNRWIKIITSHLDKPYSIAVHEAKRFLFWSDIGLNPKIERSNLYGKERTVIVNSSLTQPVNLVIDKQSERLFWLDGDLKSSDFNGSNIVTYNITQDNYTTFVIYKDIVIFGSSNGNFFRSYKISPSNNTLSNFSFFYYSNLSSVISTSLDAKEFITKISILYFHYWRPMWPVKFMVCSLETISGLVVGVLCLCQNSEDPCAYNLCEYLCVPRGDTNYVCKCPSGYTLDSDERTCILDPCADNLCEYLCVPQGNTNYVCSCSSGYSLDYDKRTCILDNSDFKSSTTARGNGGSFNSLGFKLLMTQFMFLTSKSGNLF